MMMYGLMCPCVFLLCWGKKVFDRSKFKFMGSPFTVCVALGKELIISKQCYWFCLKKEKK